MKSLISLPTYTSQETLMFPNTPWEKYELGGIPVYVKREDMCNPNDYCPQYSKIRGLETYLKNRPRKTPIGVQDAGFHSRQGWGAAYIGYYLGIEVYIYYAPLKFEGTLENHQIRGFHKKAKELGAHLIPQWGSTLNAGLAHIRWLKAKKHLFEITKGEGEMIPAMFRLKEIAMGTEWEAERYTPKQFFAGTWIFSIASACTAAGVMRALKPYQENIDMICYFGQEHENTSKVQEFIAQIAEYTPKNLQFVSEKWKYSDKAPTEGIPFPASPWYEAKTWGWLKKEIPNLRQPIIFWNIGT